MYSNLKSVVLDLFKALGLCTSPDVDRVVVDLAHYLYSGVSKSAVKTIRDLFNVSILTGI